MQGHLPTLSHRWGDGKPDNESPHFQALLLLGSVAFGGLAGARTQSVCRVNGQKLLAKTPRFCVLGSNLGTTTTFWVFFSLALPLSRPQFPRL